MSAIDELMAQQQAAYGRVTVTETFYYGTIAARGSLLWFVSEEDWECPLFAAPEVVAEYPAALNVPVAFWGHLARHGDPLDGEPLVIVAAKLHPYQTPEQRQEAFRDGLDKIRADAQASADARNAELAAEGRLLPWEPHVRPLSALVISADLAPLLHHRAPRESAFRQLCDLMSDISEDGYCAGWMMGVERALWQRAVDGVGRVYGQTEVRLETLQRLRDLAELAGGWPAGYEATEPTPFDAWQRLVAQAEG